jgi:hypothetical protein
MQPLIGMDGALDVKEESLRNKKEREQNILELNK